MKFRYHLAIFGLGFGIVALLGGYWWALTVTDFPLWVNLVAGGALGWGIGVTTGKMITIIIDRAYPPITTTHLSISHITAALDALIRCHYCHADRQDCRCIETLTELAAAEPHWTPEPIYAYRTMKVTDTVYGPALYGSFGMLWKAADPGPATCPAVAGIATGHSAPAPLCQCGYYATKDPRPAHPSFIVAKVKLWGNVIEHTEGYRAERCEIIGFDLSTATTFAEVNRYVEVALMLGMEDPVWETSERP